MTPVSMCLRVRTSVVIAKAMMNTLAAMPSRRQPIHLLKPRFSAGSSPCIHPPGGGKTDRARHWPVGCDQCPKWASIARHDVAHLRQKQRLVQPLTTIGSALDRPLLSYVVHIGPVKHMSRETGPDRVPHADTVSCPAGTGLVPTQAMPGFLERRCDALVSAPSAIEHGGMSGFSCKPMPPCSRNPRGLERWDCSQETSRP